MNFEHIFLVTMFLNMIFITTIVFFERRSPSSTIAWILVLTFTPYVGFFLYLMFGLSFRKRVLIKKKKYVDLQRKAYLKRINMNKNDLDEYAISHYSDSLVKYLENYGEAIYFTNNNVEIFTDGRKLFEDMISEIKNAKKYIYMEYYIIKADSLGSIIFDILMEKAQDGVDVKILYDGVGSLGFPRKRIRKLRKSGAKIVSFFPPFIPNMNFRLNYRNHRKILAVDGVMAYTGGFNIGDEYIGENKRFGYWRDTHLKIRGDAVLEVQKQFVFDWEFTTKESVEINEKEILGTPNTGITSMQIVANGPDWEYPVVKNGIIKMISNAKKSVYIQSPYFVPDDSMMEVLKIAVMSGIDVNIMLPNKPDHPFIYWASLSYVSELLKLGANCYIYEGGFMHSKFVVVDDKVATVGTTNIDIRSFYLNFELNAFIYDEVVVKKIKESFKEDLKDSHLLSQEEYDKRKLVVKFKESVARLLTPLL